MKGARAAWGPRARASKKKNSATRREVGGLFTGKPTYGSVDIYDITDRYDELYSCYEVSTK